MNAPRPTPRFVPSWEVTLTLNRRRSAFGSGSNFDGSARTVLNSSLVLSRAMWANASIRRFAGASLSCLTMRSSRWGELVGDCENGIDAVVACQVEVCLDLLAAQFVRPGLHFDESTPLTLTAGGSDQSIWTNRALVGCSQGHLDERLQSARSRGAERLEQRGSEIADHRQHGEQR